MHSLSILLGVVFGIIIGLVFGLRYQKAKSGHIAVELDASKSEVEKLQREKKQTENQAVNQQMENVRLQEQVKQIALLQEQLNRKEQEYNALLEENSQAKQLNSRLETQLQEERRQSGEKLQLLKEAKDQLRTEFENLANQIFDDKGKKFTEQNKANLDVLLNPLKDQITDFKKKVEDVYVNEAKERTALLSEIKTLKDLNNQISDDAKNLTRALKSENKTAGNWGEVVLERILEESGLQRDREYKVQASYHDEEGNLLRPDVTILLPGGKHVIVDSKVSLKDYERYVSAETEMDKQSAFTMHINSLRTHIKGLSDKNYASLKEINSPDFVLMFVPVEAAFLAAIEQDSTLFSDAFNRNIVIVCPSTLLVTLRTIKNIWSYEYQNRNAREIAEQAGRLYDKFAGFVTNLEDVQKHLGKATESAEKAHKQLTSGAGNLVISVTKLKKLGAKTDKQLNQSMVEIAESEPELALFSTAENAITED